MNGCSKNQNTRSPEWGIYKKKGKNMKKMDYTDRSAGQPAPQFQFAPGTGVIQRLFIFTIPRSSHLLYILYQKFLVAATIKMRSPPRIYLP